MGNPQRAGRLRRNLAGVLSRFLRALTGRTDKPYGCLVEILTTSSLYLYIKLCAIKRGQEVHHPPGALAAQRRYSSVYTLFRPDSTPCCSWTTGSSSSRFSGTAAVHCAGSPGKYQPLSTTFPTMGRIDSRSLSIILFASLACFAWKNYSASTSQRPLRATAWPACIDELRCRVMCKLGSTKAAMSARRP